MKSLSTTDRTDEAKQKLKSSNCHSYTKAYYVDDDGNDQLIEDLTYPISIKKYSEPPKYANIAYNPAAAECSFNVINDGGIYSPKNTDSDYNDIFKRDRVVKFYDGKYLQSLTTESSVELSLGDAYLFYTQFTGNSSGSVSSINIDRSNTAGNPDIYFTDLFPFYGSHYYGSVYYSRDAYCLWEIDRESQFAEKFTKVVINANSTKGSVYYKIGSDEDEMNATGTSAGWTNGGSLVNGDATITINQERGRYLWIAILYETYDSTSDVQINSVTFYYQSHIEWTLMGTFYLDDPDFQDRESPMLSMVSCTGRNAYKKALETKQNIEDISGDDLDDIIKSLCTISGITYTDDSIADLSAYGARTLATGYEDEVSIDTIFEDIMMIIGKDYRMRIDDENVMYVEARPTNYIADWVFNYRRYKQANQKFLGDKQIQRFGVVTSQEVMGALEVLSTDTFLAGGEQTASWVGNAMAKYWTITVNAGGGYIQSASMNPTSAVYTLNSTDSTVNVTITTYGCKYASEPDFMGEAVNVDNIENNDGFRSRVVNPLVISNTECKTISDNTVTEFGSPAYDIEVLTNYLNMLVEMNDQVLVVSEDFFEDSLYEVKGIEYIIASEVEKRSKFVLTDTGRNWSDQGEIDYDRDLYNSPSWQYDNGLFYDSKYPIGSTQAEILALTTYYHNTDFN